MSKIAGDINKHMMRDVHARMINAPAMELIAGVLEKHTAAILEGVYEKMEQVKARIKADEELMQQKPVAFALYSGWVLKSVYLTESEACDQRDRRQLSADLGGSLESYRVVPLYALPGAKREEK